MTADQTAIDPALHGTQVDSVDPALHGTQVDSVDPALQQAQLALEQEGLDLGITRYRDRAARAPETSAPANVLIREYWERFQQGVNAWLEVTNGKRRGPRVYSAEWIRDQWDDMRDVITFATLRTLTKTLGAPRPLTALGAELGDELVWEADWRRVRSEFPDKAAAREAFVRKRAYTTGLIKRALRKTASELLERHELSRADTIRMGVSLIEVALEVLPELFHRFGERRRKGHAPTMMVGPTESLQQWVSQAHERAALLQPAHLPMVVPPRDWTTPYDGGYIGALRGRVTLVKTRSASYLEELHATEMPEVYRAVNTLQQTAWRINRPMLKLVQQLWAENSTLGGLPPSELEPLPPKPEDIATNTEARKRWARQASHVHAIRREQSGKRVAALQKLWVAEKMAQFDRFWYVWTLDWRGRAYPVADHVHPQGDDLAKALLQFAEGKPLGETGGWWLAVHIANLFGVDKCSFDERVQWVLDHEDDLLDSAANPLDGRRFWATADKPFQALAACWEWMGYRLQGADYVSHLPIAMDGSCNGLQNLSAMLRDEVGGRAVNLVPMDQPQDVYSEVLEVVKRYVQQDIGKNPYAEVVLPELDRALVKRPVMTLPYGVTQHGMKDQLFLELQKRHGRGTPLGPDVSAQAACMYLAKHIFRAAGEVVVGARLVMDWLQEAARVAAKGGLPVHWHSPLGFPVVQSYFKFRSKQVEMLIGQRRIKVQLRINEPQNTIDVKKQAQGIAPNVVHSLDAAHMMSVTLAMADAGVTSLAMVHDSFGTHACDCDLLYTVIRETFVRQYSQPVLQVLRNELVAQLPPKLAAQLPELPAEGNLDLQQVLESQYFFA